jgi:pilus assembly protein CpaB
MAPGIPKGMRAHTIQTPNVATNVAGFVLPGNRVDVQLVFTGNEGPGNMPASLVLLQDVEILAVDQRVDAATDSKFDPNQLRSVTLLVTPDQSLKLTLAQNKGTLQLSLRNPEDKALVSAQMAQLKDLGVGMLPEKVVEKPVEAPRPAEIVPTLRSTYPGWTELD